MGLFSAWRRFTAFGLAAVFLGIGVPYLMWRSETRGRFLYLADVMEQMTIARGSGAPPEDEIRERILEAADSRAVSIEGFEVTRRIVSEGSWPEGAREPVLGVAEYTVSGTMRTESRGFEASAPLRGVIRMEFMPAE